MQLSMGIYDAPQKQQQKVFRLDLFKHHIAVFGSSMSGKTTFIKTLLVQLHPTPEEIPEKNIYIIDFSGNIGDYGSLKHVKACFNSSNEEYIKQVFNVLEKRLQQHARALKSEIYYNRLVTQPRDCPEHLILIIENLNAFLTDERYAYYQDTFLRLCRDGLSKGLTVIATASDTSGMGKLMHYFGQKIVFEMPDDAYSDIFSTRVPLPQKKQGRGLVNIGSDVYEFQAFLPFPAINDREKLRALLDKCSNHDLPDVILPFPDILNEGNIDQYISHHDTDDELPAKHLVTVGVDYEQRRKVSINWQEQRTIAIYGKRRFGKTNLLKILLSGLTKQIPDTFDLEFVCFDDGRKSLQDIPDWLNTSRQVTHKYINNIGAFKQYIEDQNGIDPAPHQKPADTKPDVDAPPLYANNSPVLNVKDQPVGKKFTVFVLQHKALFSSADLRNVGQHYLPKMIANAEANNYMFIFPDTKRIADVEYAQVFNSSISVAFLLDNIGTFVEEQGSQHKSVFGEMNAKELKLEYAPCTLGDGFYYDIEADQLMKLRFIKAED